MSIENFIPAKKYPQRDELKFFMRSCSFILSKCYFSSRFEARLSVPKDIKPRRVKVHLRFESKYDGEFVGTNAWTGEPSYISLKMFTGK